MTAYRSRGRGRGRGGNANSGPGRSPPHRRINSNGANRRVAPVTSLSSRFQQAHVMRRESFGGAGIRRNRGPGDSRSSTMMPSLGGNRRSRARKALQSVRMDIDQGNRALDRRERGNRRGGGNRGRGNRRGGSAPRGRRSVPLNKDKLDMDLDNYMLRDEKAGRSVLDQDLDAYMSGGPATTTTATATPNN